MFFDDDDKKLKKLYNDATVEEQRIFDAYNTSQKLAEEKINKFASQATEYENSNEKEKENIRLQTNILSWDIQTNGHASIASINKDEFGRPLKTKQYFSYDAFNKKIKEQKSIRNEKLKEYNNSFNEILNKNTPNEQINEIQVVEQGMNPLLEQYRIQTDINFRRFPLYKGAKVFLENGKVYCKHLEVSDLIQKKSYTGNPFLPRIYGTEEGGIQYLDIVKKQSNLFKTGILRSADLPRQQLPIGNRKVLQGNRKAFGFYVDKNLLSEMNYNTVNASDYLKMAMENVRASIDIATIQEQIYDSLFKSPKWSVGSSIQGYKDKFFPNGQLWSEQDNNTFFKSIVELKTYINALKMTKGLSNPFSNEAYSLDNTDTDIMIVMSYKECQKLQKQMYNELINGTGPLTNIGATSRLEYMLKELKVSIIGCLGLNKQYQEKTMYSYDIENNEVVFIGLKDMHQYCEMIPAGMMMDNGMLAKLDLINDSGYTKTSPIDKSILCFTFQSDIFYPTLSSTITDIPTLMKFDL